MVGEHLFTAQTLRKGPGATPRFSGVFMSPGIAEDTILRKQCGEVQIAVPTSLRHRGAKGIKHLWPPCHWGIGCNNPL
jgi:hypothetical protein